MSKIEWCNGTWNPFFGCEKLSEGCALCYATRECHRGRIPHHRGLTAHDFGTGITDWNGNVNRAAMDKREAPLKQRKPTVYFVNSLSDMFYDEVPDEWIIEAFAIMNRTPRHRYQVLTKRPSTGVKRWKELDLHFSPNIWMGCSIEMDKFVKSRIRDLKKLPAAFHFVSAEPLLGALPSLNPTDIDWLIVGGESDYSNARPMKLEWALDLRDRFRAAGTPFFFKQWGTWDAHGKRHRSKYDSGSLLGGAIVMEMPAMVYDALAPDQRDKRWTRV